MGPGLRLRGVVPLVALSLRSSRTTIAAGAGAVAFAAGRLNNLGLLDLVTADRVGHTITVLLSR